MKDKVIVLTGGNKGLGMNILNQLLKDDCYNVACISRTMPKFEDKHTLQFQGDITDIHDILRFVNDIFCKWKKIDVLINCAGMLGEFKALTEYEEKEVDDILNLNIKGVFMMTQEVIDVMNKGLIINIGSTRSITGAPNKSLYTMTKFALRGLTQCINREYNEKGIYSTIVCPGSFKTVDTKEIASVVVDLIDMKPENHIPEIIIGGWL